MRPAPSVLTLAAAAVALATIVAPARAQGVSAQCPTGSVAQVVTQDACQKAIDIFEFMSPQLGVSMTGGNTILGQGSALGGIGRFSVGLRAIGLRARVPQVQDVTPSITGARQDDYPVEERFVALPAVEAAFGLFQGLPAGVTNILAVDALVSAFYVPEFDEGNVSVQVPDGSLQIGYGARVGVLQESLVTPGVSVSFMRRELPTTNIVATVDSDRLQVRGLTVRADAWRATAGKSLGVFAVAAGFGQDRYDSGAEVLVDVNRSALDATYGPVRVGRELTRTTYFVDASLNLAILKFALELGRVQGGDVDTYNRFSGKRADDALTYASLGVRLGF